MTRGLESRTGLARHGRREEGRSRLGLAVRVLAAAFLLLGPMGCARPPATTAVRTGGSPSPSVGSTPVATSKVEPGVQAQADAQAPKDKEQADPQAPGGKKEEKTAALRSPDIHWVPTPQEVVDKMLELADVKKGDVVYDLGCGDGRIVVTAAKKYGARGVGFDIDPERVKASRENVKKNGVEDLVTIKHADVFEEDLSGASVVTLYLLPELNVKLRPQLEKLKPGSRIVSHDFDMKGAKPKKVVSVKSADRGESTVYFWTIPFENE